MKNSRKGSTVKPTMHALALALMCVYGSEVLAFQDNTKQVEKKDGQATETVIVTANKRAQNLQDVPAAISVISEAQLLQANVRDLNDLPAISPALTITYGTQPGNFSLNMRGIGTYSLGIGVEADVSVVIDDIPIGMQANAFKDLADIQRIEVLKGPQSTLLGKSSIAGALNIVTKPLETNWRTKTSTLITNDNEFRAQVSTSGAINDTMRVRLAASKTNFGGPVENLSTGTRMNGSNNTTLIGKFEWSPTDNFELVFSPRFNRSNLNCCVRPYRTLSADGYYQNITQLPTSLVFSGINVQPGNTKVRNDYPAGGRSRDAGAGLKMNYTFDQNSALAKHVFSSITSYSDYRMDDYQDNDDSDVDVLRYTLINGKPSGMTGGLYQYGFFKVKSRTQEFRLTSPDEGDFRYVLGFWYGNNRLERELTKAPIGTTVSWYNAHAYNTSYALFGQSSWEFLPNTNLVSGLRLNREDTGYDFTRFVPPPSYARTPVDYYNDSDRKFDVTGKLGVDHHVSKDTMLYGLYSTGHKGVAYDLTSSLNASTARNFPVPAEQAKNYELGTKLSLLNHKAYLNAAVFRTDFRGFQRSAGFFDTDGLYKTMLRSIGGLRTSGVELDGGIRISKPWTLNGSFAYTKAVITEFENGPCFSILNSTGTNTTSGGNCVNSPKYNNTNVADLAGKPLPNAPKYKINLGTQYDIGLKEASFDGFVSANYRWQSKVLFDLSQDPISVQPSFGITNIGFGIKDKKGQYRVSFFVNNVFDKLYTNGVGSSLSSIYSVKAPNPNPHLVSFTTWIPPRDYQRYFGVRLDLTL